MCMHNDANGLENNKTNVWRLFGCEKSAKQFLAVIISSRFNPISSVSTHKQQPQKIFATRNVVVVVRKVNSQKPQTLSKVILTRGIINVVVRHQCLLYRGPILLPSSTQNNTNSLMQKGKK
jgi:hypothetical protein